MLDANASPREIKMIFALHIKNGSDLLILAETDVRALEKETTMPGTTSLRRCKHLNAFLLGETLNYAWLTICV